MTSLALGAKLLLRSGGVSVKGCLLPFDGLLPLVSRTIRNEKALSGIALPIWEDFIRILQGSMPSGACQTILFYGIPPIVLAVLPFIVGIVIGFFAKKG